MIEFFFSIIIGLSAAVFVWAIFVLEKDLSPNILNRLEHIKRKTNPETDEKKVELSLIDFDYKIPALAQYLRKYKIIAKIKNLIETADSNMHVDTFIFLSFLCAAPFLIFIFTPFKLMTLFGFVGLFVPTIQLKNAINKRFLDFQKQFPDALGLMASSLRAGHPLFSAIQIVAEEMPTPISKVFSTVQKDISLGLDTREAFLNMTKWMPQSLDLKFFITAILIQKEVGGNLAELLDSLAITIRERFKLIGQLRVQTAQTRISGYIVGLVPVAVLLIVMFMNPAYIQPLFNTPDGKIAFASAVILVIVGFIAIKKISDIEI